MPMRWRQGIPNALTVLRLLMAPVFPFAPGAWRLPMLVVGLLTEYFDGYLARRLDGASDFGRVLDPIADKLFVFSVMLVLLREDQVSLGTMSLVMLRDIVIVLAVLWYFGRGGRREGMPRVEPTLLGKVTTAFQILFLIFVMVGGASPRFPLLSTVLLVPTVLLGLWASADYLQRYRELL